MENQKIAVLGKYSYTHILAERLFPNANFTFCQKIEDIYEEVEKENVQYGIAPIENMLQGPVRESITSLSKGKVKINKVYDFPIHHCLASKSNNYKKIISIYQAIGQCSDFLAHNKQATVEETTSTSKAMEIASKDESYAAIGSKEAAKYFNLKVLKENIEDNHDNATRFLLVSKKEENNEGKIIRTSLIITPHEDKPGILFEILKIFKNHNLNLTKVESIPLKRKLGEYEFFVEVEASEKEADLPAAEKELGKFNDVLSLGSYPIEVLD